ncbi:MAG: hypothetical protein R6V12_05725 [Candidatus Hydrogenedentota bacterium]
MVSGLFAAFRAQFFGKLGRIDADGVDPEMRGRETEAIKAALGDNWRERAMDELIAQHEELIAKWRELVEEAR